MEEMNFPRYSVLRQRRYIEAEKNIDQRFAYISQDSFVFKAEAPACDCRASEEVPHHKLYLKTTETFICPFIAVIKHQRATLKLQAKPKIMNPLNLLLLEYGS